MDKQYMSADEPRGAHRNPGEHLALLGLDRAGPPSQRLGRRRVWKRSTAIEWIESQPATAG